MKKVLLAATVVGLLLIAFPSSADPGTMYVDDDDLSCGGNSPCFSTIQGAVNAAATGDTIYVGAGTYTEQVTVSPAKGLTFIGEGRELVTWLAPPGGYCINGDMSGYTGSMNYEISGFTFNVRSDPTASWGAGIGIRRASAGPLSLTIHGNRFIEDRASGDDTHWGTSMLLCHNRYAARDGSGNAPVRVYDNIDETWGGMTMSNSQAYDIYDNIFDGCSDAIYNGHGCPDVLGQTFGDHHIYSNLFKNASDALHPDGKTPAIDWQYYGPGGATHLPSVIEQNLFESNDTAMRFVMDTDMIYPAHLIRNNGFIGNGVALRVDGAYASIVNASGNWWGSSAPSAVAAAVVGSVDYTPWLHSGTNYASGVGFDGDFTALHVDDDSPQSGPAGRIQEGIDTVAGSTVYVEAGTYYERVTVNKSLDLRGAQYAVDPTPAGARTNPAVESIIDVTGLGYANPDIAIEITSGGSNVSIDGFTILGDPTNDLADTSVIRCWASSVGISNNIMDGKYVVLYKGGDTLTVNRNRAVVNKVGVTVQPNPATNVSISNNSFSLGSSAASDASAIYMTSCSGCSVTGNTATGFINGNAVGGSNLTQLSVSGNTFTGNKKGVNIWGNSSYITISDNDLSACLLNGVNIKGQDISITGNEIHNCGDAGINIARHVIDTERVEIHQNNITGNTNYGLQVDTASVTEMVDATCNWWGDADGPYHATNAATTGDSVSDGAHFQPWLTISAPSECPGQGPLTSGVQASPNPAAVGSSVSLTATVDDTTTGGSQIVSAAYNVNGGGWNTMVAKDGSFDAISEDVAATFTAPGTPGIYNYAICVKGTDVAGNTGAEECIELMLVVYDPEGGFVTGGGWIDSPQGAYSLPATVWNQGFEEGTDGWHDSSSDWYGSITRVTSGAGGITSSDGSYHAVAEGDADSAPFTRFDGYRDTWPGTWTAEIDVYLDPSWISGQGFDYSVAATGSDGAHQRDYIFHVTKDTSTGNLLVAGSNNTNFAPREDLENINHYQVTTAGWYTFQHVFYETSGALAVDMNLLDSDGALLFTETRFNAADLIPDEVGGNRYGWFTFINVEGGIAIDEHQLMVPVGPTGKATFGFVSKYKKGASEPTGNTEFVFKAADLNFHSTSYDWLLVTGSDYARFKGSGTINGGLAPNGQEYRFMLWAGDGEPDTFRIKIWWEADSAEHVVYDNGFDQAIASGQIVVHTK